MSQVVAGAEVIVTREGKPVARIAPIALSAEARVAGLHAGAIWTSDDFDEPLPDEFWTGAA